MNVSPANYEFQASIRSHFRLLIDEFGFAEPGPLANENPFGLLYESEDLNVQVEGINWGFGVQTLLIRKFANAENRDEATPLWAIARLLRCDDSLGSGTQLDQLASHARVLRTYTADILQGNHEPLARARDIMRNEHKKTTRKTSRPNLP